MTRLADNFPTAEPDKVGNYTIDFAENVPTGTTLQAARWSLSIRATLINSATDAAPASRLIGGASVAGTISTQQIGNLIDGNDYIVTVEGTMSDGEVIPLWTVLPCRAPA